MSQEVTVIEPLEDRTWGPHSRTGEKNHKSWYVWAAILAVLALIVLWLLPSDPRGIVTIQPGQSLISYVEFGEAIDIAEQNGLDISATPLGGTAFPVSPEEARMFEGDTDRVLVAVTVMPGDQVNLDTGQYIPAK